MKTKTAHGGMRRSKLLSGTATYLILGFCVVIVLIPILWMVSTSIKIESETITIPPRWIPEHPTAMSYMRLWKEYPFLTYFKNSIIISVGAVVVSVMFSCLAGYGVTRFRFKPANKKSIVN